jgi:hypothetical protein
MPTMIRSIFATLATFVAVSAVSAQGCKASGVGDPCIPEQEFNQAFSGFDPQEVNVESKSFQCLTRVCLVNHFRGRVTCPYGQDQSGTALPTSDGASGGGFPGQDAEGNAYDRCVIPGATTADNTTEITGAPGDPNGALVHPQCYDRQAANTVYCSCRCANADGKTDDGANYCTCPDGFSCSQLVNPVAGSGNEFLAGAYCIKQGTEYTNFGSCATPCDPNAGGGQDCAPPSIQ